MIEIPEKLTIAVIPDGAEAWYAHAKEWNYGTGGSDIRKLKDNFRQGLEMLVAEHFRKYGRPTFEPLNPRTWQNFCITEGSRIMTLSLDFLREM